MTEPCELASDEWIDAMRELVEEALVGVDLSGVRVGFYEEYTNAPAHLARDGESSVTWHVEITEDGVDVGRGRVVDPLFYVEADYQGMLAVARSRSEDPELVSIVQQLQEKGQFRHIGDRSAVPAPISAALANLHNDLANRTA